MARIPSTLLVAVLALSGACDDTTAPAGECELGATRTCNLVSDCAAERRCAGQPAEWGRCECVGPVPDAGKPEKRELGGHCNEDDDCADAAFCLGVDDTRFHGGGVPGGVCVKDCSDNPAACDGFENARCIAVETPGITKPGMADSDAGVEDRDVHDDAGVEEEPGQGGAAEEASALCFESCSVGAQIADKCHSRTDVACEAVKEDAPTVGFCRPLCASDEHCAEGRSCDVRTGACVDAAPLELLEFGRACNPERGADQCEGLCVSLDDDYAACGHRCVFGEPGDCAPVQSAAPRGGCLFASTRGTIGDVGFCGELCDCEVDCSNPAALCDGFTDPELARVFGREGVCTPSELMLGEALTCK